MTRTNPATKAYVLDFWLDWRQSQNMECDQQKGWPNWNEPCYTHGGTPSEPDLHIIVVCFIVVRAIMLRKAGSRKRTVGTATGKRRAGQRGEHDEVASVISTPACPSIQQQMWIQSEARDPDFWDAYPDYGYLVVLPQAFQAMTDKQLEAKSSRRELTGFDDARTKSDRVSPAATSGLSG